MKKSLTKGGNMPKKTQSKVKLADAGKITKDWQNLIQNHGWLSQKQDKTNRKATRKGLIALLATAHVGWVECDLKPNGFVKKYIAIHPLDTDFAKFGNAADFEGTASCIEWAFEKGDLSDEDREFLKNDFRKVIKCRVEILED